MIDFGDFKFTLSEPNLVGDHVKFIVSGSSGNATVTGKQGKVTSVLISDMSSKELIALYKAIQYGLFNQYMIVEEKHIDRW